MSIDEMTEELYRALQAISSCPVGCKCCKRHEDQMREALAAFLNRWRQNAGRCEDCEE